MKFHIHGFGQRYRWSPTIHFLFVVVMARGQYRYFPSVILVKRLGLSRIFSTPVIRFSAVLFLLFPPFKCLRFQCYAVSRYSDLVESRFITYRFTVVVCQCILYTVQWSDTKRVLSLLTHHLFLEDLEPDIPSSRQGRTHKITYILFTSGSLSEKQFYTPDALKIKIFLSLRVIIKWL